MTTTELIANKIQEILGSKYQIKPFSLFANDYVKPLQTVYGTAYDINYQAFEELENAIPVSVNMQETSPINSDVFYRTGILTLQFYVPIDALGKNGKAFCFFDDYERLRNELTRGKVTIFTYKNGDGTDVGQEEIENTYKAYFTLTEPTTDGMRHGSGAYGRLNYTVQGNVTILDESLSTGDDVTVEIDTGTQFAEFNNVTNLVISRDEQGNAVQNQGTTELETLPASRVHTVSFIVYDTDEDSAVEVLRNAVFGMEETVVEYSDAVTEWKKRETKIRLKYKDRITDEFWALMSASYNVGGKTSVGSFNVSFTRTTDGIQ